MLRAVISAILVVAIATAACERKSPTHPTTSVPASSFSISGAIREKLPDGTSGLPIEGARVEVLGKLGVVSSTTCDEAGRYTIADVGGTFDLKISKDGYESDTLRVGPLRENRTFNAAIAPIVRTLVGIVTETPPSETTPIGGAKVEIVSGSNKGKGVTTDGNGYYSMAGVWGDFDVSVSSGGYEAKTIHVAATEGVTRADVRLMPDDQPAHTVLDGHLCTTEPPLPYSQVCVPGSFPYSLQKHHWLPVHRPGTMTAKVTYQYQGDYYWNYLNVEIRCESRLVVEERIANLWNHPPSYFGYRPERPIQLEASQPCVYEIKLFNYIADRKGGDWTTYRVELSHPK